MSRFRQEELVEGIGLGVKVRPKVPLLVDGDDHVQEVNSVSLKVNLSCEFDGWINTVHGVQEGSEVFFLVKCFEC